MMSVYLILVAMYASIALVCIVPLVVMIRLLWIRKRTARAMFRAGWEERRWSGTVIQMVSEIHDDEQVDGAIRFARKYGYGANRKSQ